MSADFTGTSALNFSEFAELCGRTLLPEMFPFCMGVEQNVAVYDGNQLRSLLDGEQATALKAELHRCLRDGPGVLAVRNAFPEIGVMDRATSVFRKIIAQEQVAAKHRGDHFAKPGENERIWNALQKFCELDPEGFVAYYDNPVLVLLCEAWLGPFFQVTSQVNVVKPGGQSQKPHRDYHLGFQDEATVARFPVSMQVASQFLTLQAVIAHTDMSAASGPTRLLPFSQQYPLGYLAWRNPQFAEYFEKHAIQLPLQKGDAVFLSPALFHAAGANHETEDRVANLLQVSSAFGRMMESVDRVAMAKRVYPVLLAKKQSGQFRPDQAALVGASVAEGYSFPTNLDSDPPIAGTAPETMQALLQRALADSWPAAQFCATLDEAVQRRLP